MIYSGDSPLLYTAAFSLGLAHPPGYPLYVVLGKLSTFIPLGSVAYKLNLFSALCGALASVFVFRSVYMLTENVSVSVFSAFFSAFVPLAWVESTKAEVYSLNSLLVILIFYLGLRVLKEGDKRILFLCSFILGIGMGNHHTIGFMLFPLVFAVLVKGRDKKIVLYCLLFFFIGISVYLFSYIRSLRYLSGNVLFAYSDSNTLENFIITFFRKEYGSSMTAIKAPVSNPGRFFLGASNTLKFLLFSNMGFFSLLAVFSVPLLLKKKTKLFFLLTALVSYGVILSAMVFSFAKPEEDELFLLSPYMLPLLYLSAVAVGCGLWYLLKPVKKRLPFVRRPLAIGVVLLPLVFSLPDALKKGDLSNYYLADDFSNNLLESLPPRSILISGSDASYFPVFYKNIIERKKEDVIVLFADKGGILTQVNPSWKYKTLFPDLPEGKLFSRVDETYVNKGRVFIYDIMNLPEKISSYFITVPYIHCYRLFPKEHTPDKRKNAEDFKKAFDMFVYERVLREKANDIFSIEFKMSYFISLSHYAYLLKRQGDISRSQDFYEKSLKLITPQGLVYYMQYLDITGNRDEIQSFIEAIEPYAVRYPEIRLLSTQLKEQFL